MNFDLLDKRVRSVVQDFIPAAKYTQLFISKDDQGQVLYTYCPGGSHEKKDEYASTFASLIKAQNLNQL